MAIIITDQYRLRQKNFLDDRQGIASSVSALKSWDFDNVPIPEGFEVSVGGVWYIYKNSFTVDPVTGKFRTVTEDEGVDDLKTRVATLEEQEIQLDFDDRRDTASTFAQLLTPSFWTDSTGLNHSRAGRIVTVTNDSTNNGPWYLVASDYTKAVNWVKLISRGDLITTTSGGTSSDTNLYTAKKVDSTFPKKGSAENITGNWTFKENQVFEKDLKTNTLHVTTETVTTSNTTTENVQTINVSGTLNSNGAANIKEAKIGSHGTIKDESGKTVARLDNIISPDANLTRASIGTGTITTNNVTTENVQTINVSGTLNSNGAANLKEAKIGTNGTIKDESGETVARVDKIVAKTSELDDLDQHIREQLGLIGVGNFLKNTSFYGQFSSTQLGSNTNLNGDTELYNSVEEDWEITTGCNVAVDPDSVTGYSMRLESNASIISQSTTFRVNPGTSYILSWKQKGNIQVELDGQIIEEVQTVRAATNYKYYYTKYVPSTSHKALVRIIGPGNIFEIKFEEGIIPTSWFPSVLDTDPIADEINKYEYLKASFLESASDGDTTNSNIFLKNQIKVGEVINDSIRAIYGGLSGVVSDGNDILLWSGGTYAKALELLSKVIEDETYLDNLSASQLKSLAKSVITLNYKSIFTDLYAVGKFKGTHLDEDGHDISSFPKITGTLPVLNTVTSQVAAIGFTDGRLNIVDNAYPESVNFGGTIINFSNGLCVQEEGQYTININNSISGVSELHLIFHKGYLVKVSSVKDFNTTYYWY